MVLIFFVKSGIRTRDGAKGHGWVVPKEKHPLTFFLKQKCKKIINMCQL